MSYSEQKIVERFFEVYKLNRRYSERKYGPFMPGRGQFNCLLVLDERGTLNQKDLAAYLAIRSTSAGELLKKMEKKGWIKKETSPQDKRIQLISLTKEGRAEAAAMKQKCSKAHQDMLTDLTEEEKQAFGRGLEKIEAYYQRMEAESIEPTE